MLQIFLGNDCNFNCPYCLQPKGKLKTKKLDIERIASFILNNPIKEIRFWGGEPLLYIDLIREIVAGLEHNNIIINKTMVTNGSLLNENITNYLKHKAIFTCLSYHEEMDPNCLKWLSRLEYKSINYLITKQSLYLWDLINLKDKFDATFNQDIYIIPGYVRATSSCPSEYYLTEKEIDYHIEHLRILNKFGFAPRLIETLKGQWDNIAANYTPGNAKCMNASHVSIDISGEILPCHYAQNFGTEGKGFGQIPDFDLIPSTQRHINTEKCRECDILPYCQGNCHLSSTHEIDCLLTQKLYHFLFKEFNK